MTSRPIRGRLRFRFLLLVPALVAVAAVFQGIAIGQASSLLPSTWSWATNRTFVWLSVAVSTLLTLGLGWAAAKAEAAEARRADRRGLSIETEFAFQATMGVHDPPSSAIRWAPMLHLSYTGSRVLTVLDVIPSPPRLRVDDATELEFVRTKASRYYTAYPNFGALARSQGAKPDQASHWLEEWPLLLAPGQRLRVAVEQEYEIRVNGSPMSFASDAEALVALGTYFQLERSDGLGFGVRDVVLPTRIVCTDDAWEIGVPYLILPVGATLLLPSDQDRLDTDELI